MTNHWYSIKAAAKPGGRAQVYIYGEIGDWGITADQFRRDIEALGDAPIDVRISSPGGSAFDGIAMHTILSRLSDVDTYADSAVASSATLPFMAGKRRVMAQGSSLFIHNPWRIVAGDADERTAGAGGVRSVGQSGPAHDEVRRSLRKTRDLGVSRGIAPGPGFVV